MGETRSVKDNCTGDERGMAGTVKKDAPGFTTVFVIAGMLAVAYAMMLRRRE